jgi:RND family efflux transporter MFP subunit
MLKPRPEAIAEAQAKIEAADAAVKSAQAQLDLHTIRSPSDGVLDSLTCRIGQTVAVGATIGQVVDDRRILAAVWVPVARGHSIRVGQTARVHSGNSSRSSVDADKDAKATAGSVSYVGRVADPQTANIPVHVLVENEHHAFVVGQTISATITTSELPETLSVPRAAIHDEGEGPVITTIRDGKAVVLHPQLGAADSGWIAVSGADLKPGEQVIVEGAYNLPDGTPVEVKTAAPEEK